MYAAVGGLGGKAGEGKEGEGRERWVNDDDDDGICMPTPTSIKDY